MINHFEAFGNNFLLDFDILLEPGQNVYCFIGENGIGKTKLLQTMATMAIFTHTYRECVQNKVNFNKDFVCQVDECGRKFFNSPDCIHYATSRKYNLEIITNDKHFIDIHKYCDKLGFVGK
jgi:ABC-type uncharacterized transport system ATPase subunit